MNLLRSASLVALASVAFAASAQNIVQDPGFESAAGTAGTTTDYSAGESFDAGAWLVAQPATGTFGLFSVDKDASTTISGTSLSFYRSAVQQTIATLAGRSYTIAFDAYSFERGQSILVGFGGTTTSLPLPQVTSFSPASPVGHFVFTGVATGDSTLLSFEAGDDYDELDNVSVSLNPVPEPSALAVLGLPALALLRRRKRA